MSGKNKGGRPRLIDAPAMAAFVAALRGGAKVSEATAAAGRARSTFYNQRGRCADFADAWDEAVETSAGCVFVPERVPSARLGTGLPKPRPGTAPWLRKRRRLRFDAMRREMFLAMLALNCSTTEAAAAAGVERSAVYRRMTRDPEFARAVAAALMRGYARLEAELARTRAADAARPPREIIATGEPTRDFDEAMKLMARYERPAPSLRARSVTRAPRKALTHWEAIEALEKTLRGRFGTG